MPLTYGKRRKIAPNGIFEVAENCYVIRDEKYTGTMVQLKTGCGYPYRTKNEWKGQGIFVRMRKDGKSAESGRKEGEEYGMG